MQQGISIRFIENWQVEKYFESLEEYKNNMLLVGINYDRKTKTHECKIEKLK